MMTRSAVGFALDPAARDSDPLKVNDRRLEKARCRSCPRLRCDLPIPGIDRWTADVRQTRVGIGISSLNSASKIRPWRTCGVEHTWMRLARQSVDYRLGFHEDEHVGPSQPEQPVGGNHAGTLPVSGKRGQLLPER